MNVKQGLLIGLVGAMLLLSACGEDSAAANDAVAVRGRVFSDHRVDMPCARQATGDMLPDALADITLTFSNGVGTALGTAKTAALQWEDLDYGCRFFATYEVKLARASEYRVEFDPIPPEDHFQGYFSGAEDLEPQSITLATLEAAGFEWNFEALASYVVP